MDNATQRFNDKIQELKSDLSDLFIDYKAAYDRWEELYCDLDVTNVEVNDALELAEEMEEAYYRQRRLVELMENRVERGQA